MGTRKKYLVLDTSCQEHKLTEKQFYCFPGAFLYARVGDYRLAFVRGGELLAYIEATPETPLPSLAKFADEKLAASFGANALATLLAIEGCLPLAHPYACGIRTAIETERRGWQSRYPGLQPHAGQLRELRTTIARAS